MDLTYIVYARARTLYTIEIIMLSNWTFNCYTGYLNAKFPQVKRQYAGDTTIDTDNSVKKKRR